MPNEPRQLDDWEFEAYTELRKWRLHRKLELEYRTLTRYAKNRTSRTGAKEIGMMLHGQRRQLKEETVCEHLLQVWGVGPSKVGGCGHSERGFAHEMLDTLNSATVSSLLKSSRLIIN